MRKEAGTGSVEPLRLWLASLEVDQLTLARVRTMERMRWEGAWAFGGKEGMRRRILRGRDRGNLVWCRNLVGTRARIL